MKLKDGFVLGEIAGEYVVLPSGDELDLNTMTTLNATGKFLWELLEVETTPEKMVDAGLATYDISRQEAAGHVAAFLDKLREYEFLEEK